jgi:hypothetical protein
MPPLQKLHKELLSSVIEHEQTALERLIQRLRKGDLKADDRGF